MNIGAMIKGTPSKGTLGRTAKGTVNLGEEISLVLLKEQMKSIESAIVEYAKKNYNADINEKDIMVELINEKLNIYWRNKDELK